MSKWTKEEQERLIVLWAQGKSMTLCAAELKRTRNAVAGEVYRLKIGGHETRDHVRRHPLKTRVLGTKLALAAGHIAQSKAEFPLRAPPKALIELGPRDCKWPIGTLYCGLRTDAHRSYCPYHTARSSRDWDVQRQRKQRSQTG